MPTTNAQREQPFKQQFLDTMWSGNKAVAIDPNRFRSLIKKIVENPFYQEQAKQISGSDEIAQKTIPFINRNYKSGVDSITFGVDSINLNPELKKYVKEILDKPEKIETDIEEPVREKTFRELAEERINSNRVNAHNDDLGGIFGSNDSSNPGDDISGMFGSNSSSNPDDNVSGMFGSNSSSNPDDDVRGLFDSNSDNNLDESSDTVYLSLPSFSEIDESLIPSETSSDDEFGSQAPDDGIRDNHNLLNLPPRNIDRSLDDLSGIFDSNSNSNPDDLNDMFVPSGSSNSDDYVSGLFDSNSDNNLDESSEDESDESSNTIYSSFSSPNEMDEYGSQVSDDEIRNNLNLFNPVPRIERLLMDKPLDLFDVGSQKSSVSGNSSTLSEDEGDESSEHERDESINSSDWSPKAPPPSEIDESNLSISSETSNDYEIRDSSLESSESLSERPKTKNYSELESTQSDSDSITPENYLYYGIIDNGLKILKLLKEDNDSITSDSDNNNSDIEKNQINDLNQLQPYVINNLGEKIHQNSNPSENTIVHLNRLAEDLTETIKELKEDNAQLAKDLHEMRNQEEINHENMIKSQINELEKNSYQNDLKEELQKTEQKLDKIRNEIKDKRKKLSSERNELEETFKNEKKYLKEKRFALKDLENELARQENELAMREKKINDQETTLINEQLDNRKEKDIISEQKIRIKNLERDHQIKENELKAVETKLTANEIIFINEKKAFDDYLPPETINKLVTEINQLENTIEKKENELTHQIEMGKDLQNQIEQREKIIEELKINLEKKNNDEIEEERNHLEKMRNELENLKQEKGSNEIQKLDLEKQTNDFKTQKEELSLQKISQEEELLYAYEELENAKIAHEDFKKKIEEKLRKEAEEIEKDYEYLQSLQESDNSLINILNEQQTIQNQFYSAVNTDTSEFSETELESYLLNLDDLREKTHYLFEKSRKIADEQNLVFGRKQF